jgi:hypothetical protein
VILCLEGRLLVLEVLTRRFVLRRGCSVLDAAFRDERSMWVLLLSDVRIDSIRMLCCQWFWLFVMISRFWMLMIGWIALRRSLLRWRTSGLRFCIRNVIDEICWHDYIDLLWYDKRRVCFRSWVDQSSLCMYWGTVCWERWKWGRDAENTENILRYLDTHAGEKKIFNVRNSTTSSNFLWLSGLLKKTQKIHSASLTYKIFFAQLKII